MKKAQKQSTHGCQCIFGQKYCSVLLIWQLCDSNDVLVNDFVLELNLFEVNTSLSKELTKLRETVKLK